MFVALLLAGGALLAFALAKYVPFQVDGGWYSYPALALYEHRDPGENQLTAEELLAGAPGRKARYYWDSRRNLYVLPTLAWFELCGTSWQSFHVYGLAQFVCFAAVAGLVFARFGGGGPAALACWGLLATDAVMLANAATDARPDIILATLALLLFYAAASLADGTAGKRAAIIGVLSALLLPLFHLTALATLVLIGAYLVLELRARPESRRAVCSALLLVGAGFAAFFARTAVLDRLFPTNVPEAFAQNPYAMISEKFSGGLLRLAEIEVVRWREYAWPSNGFELLAAAAGVIALSVLLRRKDSNGGFAARLFLAALCGVGVIVICSPSPRIDHLITIVPFLLLASARALSAAGQINRRSITAWSAVILLAAAFKFAHSAYVFNRYGERAGLASAKLDVFFSELVPKGRPLLIVGPAEIWPYIPPDRNVVIDDDRKGMFDFSGERWRRVDFVVLNREYDAYHWRKRFIEKYPGLLLEEVRYTGEREGGLYVAAYRIREKSN